MGKSSSKNKSTSTTNQTQQQNVVTPGTEYGKTFLPLGQELAGDVMGTQTFTGDRVAGPQDLGAGNYAAQWGQAPSIFVPQVTAGPQAEQAMLTHVDPNAQEGINAGMAAATANIAPIQGLVGQGYQRLQEFLSGDQNPHLQTILDQLGVRHQQASAGQLNNFAQLMGAQGAYGGSDQYRGSMDIADRLQQSHDEAAARLLYDEFVNRQQFTSAAPGVIAGFAGASTIPAEQLARYGGMRQENLQAAAAIGDENAQRLLNNLHTAQQRNDENAIRAAQDEIQRWQANYQMETSRVADVQGRAAAQQGAQQAGLDNEYLRWLTEQETLGSQIGNLGSLLGYAGMVPGSSMTGSMQGTTTTESKSTQQAAPWQIAAGLGGAALQMFAPGGMFSGSLGALGGIKGGVPQLPPISWPQLPPPPPPMPVFNYRPYGG